MEILADLFGIKVKSDNWAGQDKLPLYIVNSYRFEAVTLNECKCIILTPREELATIPALKKQISKIQGIDFIPVVLNLSAVSPYRRKKLIENKIPFVTQKQVYLPFIGTFLTEESVMPKPIKKVMYSTQLLILFYLYNKKKKLYVSEATKKLPFTAMTMSRAVKQLETTGLFRVSKDGVNKTIEANYDCRELYERIEKYLSSPVRKSGYLEKTKITGDMAISGESALAEETIINPGRVMTYAVNAKKFDQTLLFDELTDPYEQVKIELWEYNPKQFSDSNIVDRISLALTFSGSNDERIEQAVHELLEGVWEEYGNRI